jgi:hypothetical protein
MEYFQREVLLPCHLEVLGLLSCCMCVIVHINLEQALGWVTLSMRIREVRIIHIDRMELPIMAK